MKLISPYNYILKIYEMRLIVVYYNNMSPERVKSKRESMRNVERFSYVNTIAAENLNKIVANKLLVLLLSNQLGHIFTCIIVTPNEYTLNMISIFNMK